MIGQSRLGLQIVLGTDSSGSSFRGTAGLDDIGAPSPLVHIGDWLASAAVFNKRHVQCDVLTQPQRCSCVVALV